MDGSGKAGMLYSHLVENTMPAYTIAEAERQFEALLAAAERGEEVIITRDGQAVAGRASVARLIPYAEPANPPAQNFDAVHVSFDLEARDATA
jgi:prevent-host-death family protein